MNLSRYSKSIVAFVGTTLTWVGVAYIPDGSVDRGEWYALAVALATAAGVYGVSNSIPGVSTSATRYFPMTVATPAEASTESVQGAFYAGQSEALSRPPVDAPVVPAAPVPPLLDPAAPAL